MILQEDVDFLAHFGKKGMKWGVKNEARLQATKRVAKGTGDAKDKMKVLSRESSLSLARGKTLQGAAAKTVIKQEALKKRILKGEATTRDFLNNWGSVTIFNFG